MEANNMAAMREALNKIYFNAQYICDYKDEPAIVCYQANLIKQAVNAALSKPPRNCDVGTAEEQSRRFDNVCSFRFTGNCAGCQNPLDDSAANGVGDCALFWAQMPYERGIEE